MASELNSDVPQDNASPDPSKSLQRKLGEGFPDLGSKDGSQWRTWIESQRKKQEQVLRDKRLHWARHRHFRQGHQWISTRDGRTWREPQADVNDIKAVLNVIGPALDFRLGILSEQRPGFRHEPLGGGVSGREAAEAQQAVAEYYFYLQRAWNVYLDAWFNAQTDGVSFIHVYVDPTAGPTHEDLDLVPPTDERFAGLEAQGYTVNPQGNIELPYQEEGIAAPPGSPGRDLTEGDLTSRVVLAHEVTFDPEARSVNGPVDRARWAVIKRIRDVSQARLETGNTSLQSEISMTSQNNDPLDLPMDRTMGWQRGLPPFPTKRQKVTEGVPEYLLFITPDKNEPGLEQGIWLRLVGNTIVEQGNELPGGIIPLARVTDGSADPDIYPRPVMSDWVGDQTAINALLSTLLKHARWFAGGRMLAIKGTILEETYSNIVGSYVEYQGQKPDAMAPVPAGADAWRLLDWLIKKLEDKTGWNDIARGQLTGSSGASASDISGRAVLATRELFERAFGPVVRAAAEGATEWAHIIVRYAQWLFDEPRMIPMTNGRGDLAKQIDGEMLGDRPCVYVDPETLMPLPRALRQQMLDTELDKGHISLATYQKKSPYADVRQLPMGDSAQWERAQWINTLIEEKWEVYLPMAPNDRYSSQQGMAILYQDFMQVPPSPQPAGATGQAPLMGLPANYQTPHKAALLEIILNERKPWGMRQVALERWGEYDQLERALNDPTGQTPYSLWVTGMPPDKKAALATQLQMMTGATPGAGVPPASGAPTAGPAAAPATSASPVSSPVMSAASQQVPPKLGDFGSVERNTLPA